MGRFRQLIRQNEKYDFSLGASVPHSSPDQTMGKNRRRRPASIPEPHIAGPQPFHSSFVRITKIRHAAVGDGPPILAAACEEAVSRARRVQNRPFGGRTCRLLAADDWATDRLPWGQNDLFLPGGSGQALCGTEHPSDVGAAWPGANCSSRVPATPCVHACVAEADR